MGTIDMSEFDEANNHVQQLKVDRILDELDADRRDQLEVALQDIQYSAGAIARVLCGWGHECSADAVLSWRRKRR